MIVGQDRLLKKLLNYVKENNMAHAYIFHGEEGLGKSLIALEFASMILCKEDDIEKRPCGKCSSCKKIDSGNHPDLYLLEPEKKEYTAEQLTEIQKDMRIKPNESERKVFIFEDGDNLSTNFQNKFLKILEEPPESVIILITVNNIETLLDTTVSRCQTIKINNVSTEIAKNYISEKYGELEDNNFIISFSGGNIGKAIRLIEDTDFMIIRDRAIKLTEDISYGDIIKTMENISFLEEEKDNIYDILDILEIWFRDVLLNLKTYEKKYIINTDKYDTIKKEAEKIDSEKVYKILDIIENTRLGLNQNANYTSLINRMLIEMN